MKKAQMKMGETIAILLVFFMIIFFGIFFYANIEKRDIKERVEQMEEKKSIDVSQTISFLPELRCTSENITKSLCIDKLKKDVFANQIGSEYSQFYSSIFSNTKIELAEIYPTSGDYMTLYEGTSSEQYFTTYIPVSLFDPTMYPGRYTIGLLKITYYTFGK
jgi:sensor histidine kinase regulating citrate/malate metabolism